MIKVNNISKSYKTKKALVDFTYEFNNGIYAILGPNGSGKSTLMNIMTGNLRADKGNITIEGGSHNRSIGYVPQYPGVYADFTVYEMLDYTSRLAKSENSEKEINDLIEAFELTDYRNTKSRALSGGTKQRLAIAQAFIGSPKLVILDEPTAGLDPLQRILFKNFIQGRKNDAAIIISTHIVSDVLDIADEVIFLKQGHIVCSGNIDKVVSEYKDMCWELESENKYDENMICRVTGDKIRIISSAIPNEKAIKVTPTLDDCYLAIFGDTAADNGR